MIIIYYGGIVFGRFVNIDETMASAGFAKASYYDNSWHIDETPEYYYDEMSGFMSPGFVCNVFPVIEINNYSIVNISGSEKKLLININDY